jgi:hypothetical protein
MGPVLKSVILITPLSLFIMAYEWMTVTATPVPAGGVTAAQAAAMLFIAAVLPAGSAVIAGHVAGRATAARRRKIFSASLALYFASAIIVAGILIFSGSSEIGGAAMGERLVWSLKLGFAGAVGIGVIAIPVILLYTLALEKWTRKPE